MRYCPRPTTVPPPTCATTSRSCMPTSAIPRRWRGRCGASTPSATRPRWSGSAWTWATSPTTWRTTTSARPCCSRRCTVAGSEDRWCWRARWSCTARDGTDVRKTASSGRVRARRRIWPAAGSSRVARRAGVRSFPRRSPRTPRSIHGTSTPRPSCTRSTCVAPTSASTRRRPSPPSATTTSTGRGCRATRRTRGSRASSGARSSAASAPRCTRTARNCAISCTWTTWRARTRSRSRRA